MSWIRDFIIRLKVCSFVILGAARAVAADKVIDLNGQTVSRTMFLAEKFVQDGISNIEKQVIQGETFQFDPTVRIISRAEALPEDVTSESHVQQTSIIMIESNGGRFLCQLDFDLMWVRAPLAIVSERSKLASSVCYPKVR